MNSCFICMTEARIASGPATGPVQIALSRIAEADAEAACGAHQGAVGVDLLRPLDGLGERHVDDAAVLPGHHAVETTCGDEVDRMHAECRRYQAVIPGGLAAALHMTKHGDPGFGPGQLGDRFAQNLPDAPIGDAAARLLAPYALAGAVGNRLGDDDQGKVAAGAAQP